MPGCAFPGCRGSRDCPDSEHISFHRFPKGSNLKEAWLRACELREDFPTEHTNARICSRHFNDDDFERDLKAELLNLKEKRQLKNTAVPRANEKKAILSG